MSQRGRGSCPKCKAEFFNRSKPKNCAMCGFEIGGKFEPSFKRVKVISPTTVPIADGTFSVRTSNRDDRCFVSTDGKLWMCSMDECKIKRSVLEHSSKLESFSCKHVEGAKDVTPPIAILTPDLQTFPCSEAVKKEIQDILCANQDLKPVVQVSESSFVVLGQATATNPVGYCHVRKSTKNGNFLCTGKDCRGFSSKGKQSKTKSMCSHVILLLSCFQQALPPQESQIPSAPPPDKQYQTTAQPANPSGSNKAQVKRDSTIRLAEQLKTLPYDIPQTLLHEIAKKDACSLLGKEGGWPEEYIPEVETCQLCGTVLGSPTDHPGQRASSSYLVTELNPFKKVIVKVKNCSSDNCLAIHQAQVEKIGLFNISDKVLISFDVMLELREFFKKGHPLGNVIAAKLASLRKKCYEKDNPSDSEISYLEDLLYKGFYCFEIITERNLDDVVCGVCGICPQICLGDGNEKNCCSNNQINYTKKGEPLKNMLSLEDFTSMLKQRWVEKAVYTRTQLGFSVSLEQLPPLIAPSMGNSIINTEAEKRSVYLQSNIATGDPALLHKMISNGDIEMENLQNCDLKEILKACQLCKIPTSGKSKEYLCGMLNSLYESILIGNCPCHSFGKLPGHTGGFYHLVCRHGTTVASKFLTLTESVRDAADLYLSLKHPPVVFINDTPCGFVRHLECRDPAVANKLWGDKAGCFEKPEINKLPSPDQNVPALVPSEFSNGSVASDGRSKSHFVLGDRFHAATQPHKSALCQFHDINLCLQANTIKTSTQESQNNAKNRKRLRSSCMQSFEVHFLYNLLMDFYENEEIVAKQYKILEKTLAKGQQISRDNFLRFTVN